MKAMNEQVIYDDGRMVDLLRQAGVRPSVQRLAVACYVANRKTHPTAEEVFESLSAVVPTLSVATVYNSLNVLTEAGILRKLETDGGTMRYDFARQPQHGHFTCSRCGKIFDIPMPEGLAARLPEGFVTESMDFYLKGVCPECS